MQTFAAEVEACPLCKRRADKRALIPCPSVKRILDSVAGMVERYGIDDIMESQLFNSEPIVPPVVVRKSQRQSAKTRAEDDKSAEDSSSEASSSNSDSSDDEDSNPHGGMLRNLQAMTQGLHLAKTQFQNDTTPLAPRSQRRGYSNPFGPPESVADTVVVEPSGSVQGTLGGQGAISAWRLQANTADSGIPSAGHSPAYRQQVIAQQNTLQSPSPRKLFRADETAGEENTTRNAYSKRRSKKSGSSRSNSAITTTSASPSLPATGPCALCGLDSADRKIMKQFLKRIVTQDATCDRSELVTLDQVKLDSLLGTLQGPYTDHAEVSHTVSPAKGASADGNCSTRIPAHAGQAEGGENDEEVDLFNKPREQASFFAHYLCLLWSPEVTLKDGMVVHGQKAIQRGRRINCSFCGLPGATLNCCDPHCNRNFHVPCAFLTGFGVCSLDLDEYTLCCPEHREVQSQSLTPVDRHFADALHESMTGKRKRGRPKKTPSRERKDPPKWYRGNPKKMKAT